MAYFFASVLMWLSHWSSHNFVRNLVTGWAQPNLVGPKLITPAKTISQVHTVRFPVDTNSGGHCLHEKTACFEDTSMYVEYPLTG